MALVLVKMDDMSYSFAICPRFARSVLHHSGMLWLARRSVRCIGWTSRRATPSWDAQPLKRLNL
jgi:hypothetical protein